MSYQQNLFKKNYLLWNWIFKVTKGFAHFQQEGKKKIQFVQRVFEY